MFFGNNIYYVFVNKYMLKQSRMCVVFGYVLQYCNVCQQTEAVIANSVWPQTQQQGES